MDRSSSVLPNGVTLKTCRLANTHCVTIALFLKAGCFNERPSKRGITHLVEHLCFRGWRGQSQVQFYQKIERIGGFLRAATYRDHVVFEITVDPLFLEEAADLIYGLFADHIWSDQDLRREKEVVLRQIEKEYFPLSERLLAEYFFGNARTLSIMGAPSRVKRFTKRELTAWKQFLFQPEKACVILTGNFTDRAFELVLKEFSSIKRHAVPLEAMEIAQEEPLLFKRFSSDVIYCSEKEFSSIGLLFRWNVQTTSLTEMDFLRSSLAAGLYAPLILRLREDLGLLDEIDSGVELDNHTGLLYFTFDLNHHHLPLFFSESGKIFHSARKTLDAGAFQCAKACFVNRPYALLDNPQEFAYLLGERTFLGKESFCTAEEYIETNRQISFEQLNDVARMVFTPECLSMMALTTDALYDQVDNAFQCFRDLLEE